MPWRWFHPWMETQTLVVEIGRCAQLIDNRTRQRVIQKSSLMRRVASAVSNPTTPWFINTLQQRFNCDSKRTRQMRVLF